MSTRFFPTPFGRVPHPELLDARRSVVVPDGFVGYAGVLLTEKDGVRSVYTAFEPLTCGKAERYEDLTADGLWPLVEESDVPDIELVNGRGETFTFKDFLTSVFAMYPDRPHHQGGRELAIRRAQWRSAFLDAMTDPAVQLLLDHNRRQDGAFPIGVMEWWVGESPAHEIRHDGAVYSPRAAAKLLFEALVEGIPYVGVEPHVSEEAVPEVPVLYVDDDIIVVNKPSRLASVPGVRETVSTVSILEKTYGPLRIVHRLDMDTSGVLLFARNLESERALHEVFRSGLAMKRYEARLTGVPKATSGHITLPLALNRLDRPRQCVLLETETGKPSVTDWELLRIEKNAQGVEKAIVSLWPETGRTHQLRVHCAHRQGIGLAIDGDSFYGPMGILAEVSGIRLCLHAAELTLPHPRTGVPVHFEAPADFPDFEQWWH